MEQLELKQLVAYPLGKEGISVVLNGSLWKVNSVHFNIGSVLLINNQTEEYYACKINDIKLVLRPLSDLTKEIEVNGEKFKDFCKLLESITKNKWVYFQDKEEIYELTYGYDHNGNKYYSILDLPYFIIQKLLEHHFDVYGLIEKGLAIKND